jgi:hypothetical protein
MYREAPDGDQDSGWRVFSGNEDQAFANNPDNLAFYDVTSIAAADPDVLPYLMTPAPCAFERRCASEPFKRVNPPTPAAPR